MKNKVKDCDIYKDRESQITAIERSFELTKNPVCFYSTLDFFSNLFNANIAIKID